MYNGKFKQNLAVIIDCDNQETCLDMTKRIKRQCDAWWFNVSYKEYKSARKGDVLKRELSIVQTAYAGDILIFKEALRRVCQYYSGLQPGVEFIDQGTEPVNDLRSKY